MEFEVVPSPAEELTGGGLTPAELTECNAALKAEAVSALHPDAVVLGADTLVFLDGEALGKPRDREEALDMLQRLRGRTHEVITGVAIQRIEPAHTEHFHAVTRVTFHDLDDTALRAYRDRIEPLDKAGAYAAQDEAAESPIIAGFERRLRQRHRSAGGRRPAPAGPTRDPARRELTPVSSAGIVAPGPLPPHENSPYRCR